MSRFLPSIPNGIIKPPRGVIVNHAHPFARNLAMGVLFQGRENFQPFYGTVARRTVSAAASYTVSSTVEGPSALLTTSDTILLGSDPIPTGQVTILFIRMKTSSGVHTNGLGFTLVNSVSANYRCLTHLPFSDGTCYWDFGGSSAGTTRISVAGLSFSTTQPERWVFTAGPRGMAMWRNGVKLASQGTANTGRVKEPLLGDFGINSGGGNGQATHVNFFQIVNVQWDDSLIRAWSANPYEHLIDASSHPWSFVSATGGALGGGPLVGSRLVGGHLVGGRLVA